MKTYTSVIEEFLDEFENILKYFVIYNLSINEAQVSSEDHVWKPGVYVFWNPEDGVIKVGRHLTNSRKRALEHIRDNTGGEMSSLADNEQTRLLLFNLRDESKRHWAAAVEVYLETALKPKIKSKRLG